MNLIGYDAMAVGNHEFDNPLSVLRQQESGLSSRSCRPIFIRKAPANGCSNHGRCLSAVG